MGQILLLAPLREAHQAWHDAGQVPPAAGCPLDPVPCCAPIPMKLDLTGGCAPFKHLSENKGLLQRAESGPSACIVCDGSPIMTAQRSPCWAGHSHPPENDAPAPALPEKLLPRPHQPVGNLWLVALKCLAFIFLYPI